MITWVETKEQYNAAIKRIEEIYQSDDSEECAEYSALVDLVITYEKKHHPILPTDTIE
jgi:antitoxin component HigA of HigAB toxin-antitoxin module